MTALSADEPVIEVSGLRCRYGEALAVDGIDFTARRGEVLGFLGPNGAGKSTTMAAICGVRTASGGTIRITGTDLRANPVRAKAALGYLPEHPPLYAEMTVREYLRFCARLRRVPGPLQADAVERALQRCELTAAAGRVLGNLSKGFQQRAGIAQAIIHRPALIVLDEPTVGLDPNQIRQIRHLIRELAAESAVILCTHLLPEVLQICDRVLILHEGRVVLRAPLSEFDPTTSGREIRVRFDRPPTADRLAAVPQIEAITALTPGEFRLRCADAGQAVEALLAATLSQGWGLRELTEDRRSLEEVFVALTLSEPGEGGPETDATLELRAAGPSGSAAATPPRPGVRPGVQRRGDGN